MTSAALSTQISPAATAQPASSLTRYPFNALTASLRQRIVALLMAPSLPASMRRIGGEHDGIAGPLLGTLVLGGLSALFVLALGSPVNTTGTVVVSILLFLSVLSATVTAMATMKRLLWKQPPWPLRATLSTPFFVVHVEGEEVVVSPLNMQGRPRLTQHFYNSAYRGTTLDWTDAAGNKAPGGSIHLTSDADATALLAELPQARNRFIDAQVRGDRVAMDREEPFWEALVSNQWTTGQPTTEGPLYPTPAPWFKTLSRVAYLLLPLTTVALSLMQGND